MRTSWLILKIVVLAVAAWLIVVGLPILIVVNAQ